MYKVADLVGALFGKDRTVISVRCDRYEVSIAAKVRNTKKHRIHVETYRLVVAIVQSGMDADVVESRPVRKDSHFKFATTWPRAEAASATAHARRRYEDCKDWLALSLIIVACCGLLRQTCATAHDIGWTELAVLARAHVSWWPHLMWTVP